MTPKDQYNLAYSAIRYEYQNEWKDVEWNPNNKIDRKRTSDIELVQLPSHIVGIALKHYLMRHSGYYADKLKVKEAIRDYMLDRIPDLEFYVSYRKKGIKNE